MLFIREVLAANDVDVSGMYNPADKLKNITDLGGLLSGGPFDLINFLFIIIGLIFFANLIMAGWDYMLSTGDPKKVASATTRFTNSFLGIVVALTAFLIVRIITNALGLGNLV